MTQSKKERKKQRKLEQQLANHQKRQQIERSKKLKQYSITAAAIFLVVVAIYFLFIKQPDLTDKGVLRIAQQEVVLGAVSVRGGVITKEVSLVNIGEGDLTINGLDSSCGCTTASITNNEVESPIFQMGSHGRNPSNWKTVIRPGETATLNIMYDPATHPDLRGAVTRIVTIFSDSPGNGEEKVNVRVNQID